ncbi:acyl-CoA dehydrogenase family protein [Streptomyces lasalocidi]
MVVLATAPSGPVLFTLTPDQAVLTPGGNLAEEPRDDLHLAALEIPAAQVRRISPELLDEARLRAALARSALIAGAAERCVELTVAHTTARTQFGRPLSRFQAVKQEEARLIEEAALVRAAVQAAAAPLDTGGAAAHFAVAAAKTQASASATEVTRIAHQLHGAIGITRLNPSTSPPPACGPGATKTATKPTGRTAWPAPSPPPPSGPPSPPHPDPSPPPCPAADRPSPVGGSAALPWLGVMSPGSETSADR